jgi:hypothetical protein
MSGLSPSQGTRCRRCHKAILWPGLCYTCATGLPRQLRRAPDETRETTPSAGRAVRSAAPARVPR